MRIPIGAWCLRSMERGDVDALVRYANNRNLWLQLRDRFPHPYTERDALHWIESNRRTDSPTQFAIASPEELIGGIGLEPQDDVYRRSAEIGYWLGEPHWGRGIATLALVALTEYAFSHFDLVRLYAYVFETNPASARVLEKAGYTYEGRLEKSVLKAGKVFDQWLYARVRSP